MEPKNPDSPHPDDMIHGPMSPGQIRGTADFLESGASVHGGQLVVPPEHIEWARLQMEEQLADRASEPTTFEAQNPSETERYPSPEEVGKAFYDYIIEQGTTTGENGPFFLNGKYPPGWIPGLPDHYEWKAAVYDEKKGTYRDGVYISRIPDFELVAAITQRIANTSEHETTNFLITYPSPTQPGQMVCSYNTWQDARYFGEHRLLLAPNDCPMSLNWEMPEEMFEKFMNYVKRSPHILEGLLQASPYGQLMYDAEPHGPIVRNQSAELLIINAEPSPDDLVNLNRSRLAASYARQVQNGGGLRVPINPPIGDSEKSR